MSKFCDWGREPVNWHNEERKERFLVVSKSGFTKKCIERMDEEGVMRWNLEDLQSTLTLSATEKFKYK